MQDDEEQMFVDIENYKSPLAIENLLIPYKRGRLAPDKKSYLPKEPITSDICFEVLKSTNAPRSIKDMLSCIADLPPSQQAQFKDVVLATFTQREQPNTQPHNVVLLGRKLAQASGYEAELVEAQKVKEGRFLSSASYVDRSFVTFKKSFSYDDFSAYNKVIFLSSEKIQFFKNVKFPKNMEFPNSSDVDLFDCDLQNGHGMLFKDGAVVKLGLAQNLPPNLDFSCCSTVDLNGCDLCRQSNLAFKDGAIIRLYNAKNLPPQLDFSRCNKVNLEECDLSNQPNLAFKDGAIVNLSEAYNLPSNLDVSLCSYVNLSDCDLSNQTNLSFKDGAIVNLNDAYNLPPDIDVSLCSKVDLSDCDLSSVKELTFKNREQMEKSGADVPDDWKGKLVFADEQTEFQKEVNIDASAQFIESWGKFVGKIFGKGGR